MLLSVVLNSLFKTSSLTEPAPLKCQCRNVILKISDKIFLKYCATTAKKILLDLIYVFVNLCYGSWVCSSKCRAGNCSELVSALTCRLKRTSESIWKPNLQCLIPFNHLACSPTLRVLTPVINIYKCNLDVSSVFHN